MTSEPLRATQAARQLGIPTREIIRVLEEKIRYVVVDGMVHFQRDAVDEYRAQAS